MQTGVLACGTEQAFFPVTTTNSHPHSGPPSPCLVSRHYFSTKIPQLQQHVQNGHQLKLNRTYFLVIIFFSLDLYMSTNNFKIALSRTCLLASERGQADRLGMA